MNNTTITVAIITYNRASLLYETLDALLGQNIDLSTFEMLIVDNASTDETAKVIKLYAKRFPIFTSVYESHLGQSYARNAVLEHASTDWICYLDDDAKAAPNYVKEASFIINTKQFPCFGGAIEPWKRDPLPPWFLDAYEQTPYSHYTQATQLQYGDSVFGGNMVVRKDIATEVGGFDCTFGTVGTNLGYGEETEFQMRIWAAGYTITYVPSLIVYHYARPEKYTFLAQLKIRFRMGISYQMIQKKSSLRTLVILCTLLFVSPAKGFIVSLKRIYKGTYRWQNAFLEVAGRFEIIIGRLVGWSRLRKNTPHCR